MIAFSTSYSFRGFHVGADHDRRVGGARVGLGLEPGSHVAQGLQVPGVLELGPNLAHQHGKLVALEPLRLEVAEGVVQAEVQVLARVALDQRRVRLLDVLFKSISIT